MVNSTRKRSRVQSAEPRRGLALLLDETDLARPDTRRAALVPTAAVVMPSAAMVTRKHPQSVACGGAVTEHRRLCCTSHTPACKR